MLLLFQFQFQNLQLILYISNRTGDQVLKERGKRFNSPPELIQPVAGSSRQVMGFHSYSYSDVPEHIVPPPESSAFVNPLPELNASFNDPVFGIFHDFFIIALLISEIKQPLSWTLFHFPMKFFWMDMISQRFLFFFLIFCIYLHINDVSLLPLTMLRMWVSQKQRCGRPNDGWQIWHDSWQIW